MTSWILRQCSLCRARRNCSWQASWPLQQNQADGRVPGCTPGHSDCGWHCRPRRPPRESKHEPWPRVRGGPSSHHRGDPGRPGLRGNGEQRGAETRWRSAAGVCCPFPSPVPGGLRAATARARRQTAAHTVHSLRPPRPRDGLLQGQGEMCMLRRRPHYPAVHCLTPPLHQHHQQIRDY